MFLYILNTWIVTLLCMNIPHNGALCVTEKLIHTVCIKYNHCTWSTCQNYGWTCNVPCDTRLRLNMFLYNARNYIVKYQYCELIFSKNITIKIILILYVLHQYVLSLIGFLFDLESTSTRSSTTHNGHQRNYNYNVHELRTAQYITPAHMKPAKAAWPTC